MSPEYYQESIYSESCVLIAHDSCLRFLDICAATRFSGEIAWNHWNLVILPGMPYNLVVEKLSFRTARTKRELTQAMAVRRAVFIVEQKIDEAEEYDGLDDTSLHFIAVTDRKIVGTARVRFPSPKYAKIERMAVLKEFRRCGVGAGILALVEKELKARQVPVAMLHAQITAAAFYESRGYKPVGAHFYEAGIEHSKMKKNIGKD
jgi:predicted GNAT family N-acyltransferase